MMRDGLFYELGVRFPGIRVRGNETDMPASSYLIMVNEIPLVMGTVNIDKVLVNDTAEGLGSSISRAKLRPIRRTTMNVRGLMLNTKT